MAKKPLVINWDYSGNNKTYNLKNYNSVNITFLATSLENLHENLQAGQVIFSGTTLKIKLPGGKIQTFKNVSANLPFRIHTEEGIDSFNSTISAFCQEFVDFQYIPNKNRVISGTVFDDEIDLTDTNKYPLKNGKGYTINALAGHDTITGTAGDDTITGGLGKTDVVYDNSQAVGKDVIKLTSGEQLEIKGDAFNDNYTLAQGTDKKSKNDLVVKFDDNNSITLKNYYGKETGATVLINNHDLTKEAMLEEITAANYFEKEGAKKVEKYTGSALADTVDASGLTEPLKIKKGVEYGVTINSGAGDDIITGSDYLDTLNGGNGEDKLIGGKGNDKLSGGKDFDTFIFYKNDGVDTITDANNEDIITIADDNIYASWAEGGTSDLRYAKNGKNLEIFYSNDYDQNNKIVVQNYYKQKDETKRIQAIYLTTTDMNTETNPVKVIELPNITTAIESSGKFSGDAENNILLGSAKADTIKGLAGADEIYGYAGNDNIYGGLGDDTINAGAGKNNIYYSLGDGNDTIVNGDGEDTLVFDSGITVTAEYNGNDAVVTYSGTKNGEAVSNTITIEDYKNEQSVKYIKIGKDKAKDISTYLNGGGGDDPQGAFVSTSNDEYWLEDWSQEWGPGAKLTQGNHTFYYDVKNTDEPEDYPHFGYDLIQSPNHVGDGNTDTFEFKDFSVQHGLEFTVHNDDMDINLWKFSDNIEQNNDVGDVAGVIAYTDLLNISKQQSVVVKDKDNISYNVKTSHTGMNNSTLTTNTINLVERDEYDPDVHAEVISNNKYNYTATHNINLHYTYNGGIDKINTYDNQNTNDIYDINTIANDTQFVIRENGGTNDMINFKNTNADDLRILFNVSVAGFDEDDAIYIDKRRMMFVLDSQTDAKVLQGLKAVSKNGYYPTDGGVFVYDHNYNTGASVGIEDIIAKDIYVEDEAGWFNAIATKVGAWLKENHEHSVETALWAGELPNNEKLAALINCYKSVKYSEREDVERGADIEDYVPDVIHNGTDGNDSFISTSANERFNLLGGNDTINFGRTISSEIEDEGMGSDDIYSISSTNKANTDTLNFTHYGITDDEQNLYLELQSGVGEEEGKYNLLFHAMDNVEEIEGGDVVYHNFLSSTVPNVRLIDTTGTYYINGYTEAKNLSNQANDTKNHIDYVVAESGKTTSAGNTKYNYLYTAGGTNLEYTYNGGCDTVYTTSTTNDTYNVNGITASTSFAIQDAGGTSDVLDIKNVKVSDLRMFIDVDKTNSSYDVSNIAIMNKNSFTTETIPNIYSGVNIAGGVHVYAFGQYNTTTEQIEGTGIETIKLNNIEVNQEAWYDAITQNVVTWLNGTEYDKASEAITAYNNNPDSVDISGLIAAYKSVDYSTINAE